jgi:hypothetical protein
LTSGKDPVPIVQKVVWASGPVWKSAENLAPTGIRSLDRPACRQSLYRIRYPAAGFLEINFKMEGVKRKELNVLVAVVKNLRVSKIIFLHQMQKKSFNIFLSENSAE